MSSSIFSGAGGNGGKNQGEIIGALVTGEGGKGELLPNLPLRQLQVKTSSVQQIVTVLCTVYATYILKT